MSQDRVDQYRQWAEECRTQAQTALREEDKEAWLKLAAKWQTIARGANQGGQQAQQPQPEEKP